MSDSIHSLMLLSSEKAIKVTIGVRKKGLQPKAGARRKKVWLTELNRAQGS